jgi:hypothetical protein
MRKILLSLFLMLMTAATIPVAATALPTEGPWYHVGGAKLAEGESHAKEGTGKGSSLKQSSVVGGKEVVIKCENTVGEGKIWNGSQQGEGSGKIKSTGCEVVGISSCVVPPIVINNKGTLWYHMTNSGEKTGKIQVLLGSPSGAEVIYKLIIESCALKGTYNVTGNVAAEISPEKEEASRLKVIFPKEQQARLWQPIKGELKPSLHIGGSEVHLEGEEEVELVSKEMAGVFET